MLLWWEVQPKWFERLKKSKKYKRLSMIILLLIFLQVRLKNKTLETLKIASSDFSKPSIKKKES